MDYNADTSFNELDITASKKNKRQFVIPNEYHRINSWHNNLQTMEEFVLHQKSVNPEEILANSNFGKSLKVAIITPDIINLDNGCSYSTYFYGLAKTITDGGHNVDIVDLKALGRREEIKSRVRHNLLEERLRLIDMPIPQFKRTKTENGKAVEGAYLVLEFLKLNKYDIVHIPLEGGLPYYYLQAKRFGLITENSFLCVHISTPTLYKCLVGSHSVKSCTDSLIFYMEKRSAEIADSVVVRSRTVFDWMKNYGYNLIDENIFIDPGLTIDPPAGLGKKNDQIINQKNNIKNLVFVGRLNQSKGLTTFCYALNDLIKRGTYPEEVIFFGAKDPEFPLEDFLANTAKEWPFHYTIKPNSAREEVLLALMSSNTLAVVPSLFDERPLSVQEFLAYGIPFVATRVGDLPDLVGNENFDFLVEPHYIALADRIEAYMNEGYGSPQKFSLSPQLNRKIWLKWHQEILAKSELENQINHKQYKSTLILLSSSNKPIVSVCMAHYNRPEMLKLGLESFLHQTFQDFEVIIVDDGSTEEAKERLQEIASIDDRIRLVFQNNLYLGAARNTGAYFAKGQYLLFADDDNYAKPHELETFLKVSQSSEVDIFACFSDNFNGEDKPNIDNLTYIRRLPVGADLTYGLFRNGFGDSNCFMRTETWKKLGGFTEHYRIGLDDHELFARAILNGFSVEVIPEALYYYRCGIEKMKRFHVNKNANFIRILQPYIESGFLDANTLTLSLIAKGLFQIDKK